MVDTQDQEGRLAIDQEPREGAHLMMAAWKESVSEWKKAGDLMMKNCVCEMMWLRVEGQRKARLCEGGSPGGKG